MKTFLREILYGTITFMTKILMIPGFIVGSCFYIIEAFVFSIIGDESLQGYIGMYLAGAKEFLKNYKKNFWEL